MRRENVALVGYGHWGTKIAACLRSGSQFSLKYIFSPSRAPHAAGSRQPESGAPVVADSLATIWQDREVPHVIIATPIRTHYELARAALSHGKNVLVEKPMTTSAREATLLARMAEDTSRVLMTEYTYTFSAALAHAKRIVEQGGIGPLRGIQIELKQLGRFRDNDVHALLGSHALSILDLFVPLNHCRFDAFPLQETAGVVTSAIVRFDSEKDRCRGSIDISLHMPARSKTVSLFGEDGTLIYRPDDVATLVLITYRRERDVAPDQLVLTTQSYSFDETHNLALGLQNYYRAVRGEVHDNRERAIAIASVLDSFRPSST